MDERKKILGNVDMRVVMHHAGQHKSTPQTFTMKDVITHTATCATEAGQ